MGRQTEFVKAFEICSLAINKRKTSANVFIGEKMKISGEKELAVQLSCILKALFTSQFALLELELLMGIV